MPFSAKVTATDAAPQPIGDGNYGDNAFITNLGPDVAWIYTGSMTGTDAEKASQVVALGTPIVVNEKLPLTEPGGASLADYYVACASGETADCRILA